MRHVARGCFDTDRFPVATLGTRALRPGQAQSLHLSCKKSRRKLHECKLANRLNFNGRHGTAALETKRKLEIGVEVHFSYRISRQCWKP